MPVPAMRLILWACLAVAPSAIYAFKQKPKMEDELCISTELLEASCKYMQTKDSKLLVDYVFTESPDEIDRKINARGGIKSMEDFESFLKEVTTGQDDFTFIDAGVKEQPGYISKLEAALEESRKIVNPPDPPGTHSEEKLANLIEVAKRINDTWNALYVSQNGVRDGLWSTMVSVKNPFMIPGSRFKECYYWDTYWIIEGLLTSGMDGIAIEMVENFFELIEAYGFVPNGLRKYYLNRSQPSYFPMMLLALYRHLPGNARAMDVIRRGLEAAKKEYRFFMKYRRVTVKRNGKAHRLNLYRVRSQLPRPESYKEDVKTARDAKEKHGKPEKQTYTDLKSAAESGWDFSSRFMRDRTDLGTIRTSVIIPVDLNAILYANELIIAKLSEVVGNVHDAKEFRGKSERRREAINAVLWNSAQRIWNDYDLEKGEYSSQGFYASNLAPMCYGISPPDAGVTVYDVLDMFKDDIFGHVGGMPASGAENKDSQQQWDYPNVWPPLLHIMASFLHRVGERSMALHIARSLIEHISASTSELVPEAHRGIFEKYSCERVGDPGQKGEYTAQVGFGWTNGAAIDFLNIFSTDLVSPAGVAFSSIHKASYEDIKEVIRQKVESREATPVDHTPENCLLLSPPHEEPAHPEALHAPAESVPTAPLAPALA